jgi:NAD(P)H-nitrite reductase large subunit
VTSLDWKDAPVTKVICVCGNVKKVDIIHAVVRGARGLDDIKRETGACANTRETNAACRNCRADVEKMIEYYGALAEAMGGGGRRGL